MRGERPKAEHLAAVWDESQQVGRSDVTDIVEAVIDALPMQQRLYPDLYAHAVTRALLDAGLITGDHT